MNLEDWKAEAQKAEQRQKNIYRAGDAEASAYKDRRRKRLDRIEEHIRKGPTTVDGCAETLGMTVRQARGGLLAMVKRGIARRVSQTEFEPTGEGI